MTKEYVISDLHGRYDLLLAALSKIHNNADSGIIIFTGDYIDRGPQNREILEFLMKPVPSNWEYIILKGNHDEMMEKCDQSNFGDTWIANGGLLTYKQYLPFDNTFTEHRNFISTMKLYHETEHRVYVHAYVNPALALDVQTSATLLWNRYPAIDDVGYRGKYVVHGHTPNRDPIIKKNRANFDTYAVGTGRLVVGIFDSAIAGGPINTLEVTLEK